MSIFKFITLSQLRKVLSALETRFKKIENDVENPPTPDWNQNDPSKKNYIANRVCYVGDSEMNHIISGEIPAGDSHFSGHIDVEFITEGKQYRVIWNELPYTGTINYDSQYRTYLIGNCNLANNNLFENTEEPFCIIIYSNGEVQAFPEETNSGLNIQFNLYINMPTVHKLDDMYLNGKLVMEGSGYKSAILSGSTNSSADGDYAVSEGSGNANGYYSHAEGDNTTASDYSSHAEGYGTTASGYSSHAEGYGTTASGSYSHAEGNITTASKTNSHAEGYNTTASGTNSHAEGFRTVANHKSQHVFGEYNVVDPSTATANSRGNYVEIVGNGASATSHSNARTLDWSGNEVLAGKLTVGAAPTNNMDVATKQYVDTSLSGFSPNLSGLTDTTISSPANGQTLMYDSSASKWKNQTINIASTIGQLTDTTISSPSNGQALIYDSSASKWKNQTINIASTVNQLTDATISSPSNGQVLMYNSTTSKWENTSLPHNENNQTTLETEWVDVYSDWAAGYYYDPDNDYAYTQIPSTERSWGEAETYVSTSCTPYSNMIPVQPGEEYRYYNMPIHFDSKNAEVPGVIIFDSNKSEIDAITQTYQDENPSIITIPADGAWMAVLYANSQTYVLQKKVAKRLDKNELLDTIKADYRAYTSTTIPTASTLTKTYICLGTDDLRGWETKNLHTLFTTNNIPYYMAAIPDNIKACVAGDPYKTNLDYMRLCVAAGGEIISHSNPVITEQNKNDFDTMYTYFCKNKEQLEYYGFKVRGIFKAGGENAIYDAADPVIDAWAAHYYDFGDYFGGEFPYGFERTLLDDWADYSYLANAIRSAMQNHTPFIGAFHHYNSNAELAMSTILDVLKDYTKGTDYEFVTPSQLYDIMMPTTRPSGGGSGGATPVTYSVSMSSNVITLTGSNGSTSSVTLPIYTGGVT